MLVERPAAVTPLWWLRRVERELVEARATAPAPMTAMLSLLLRFCPRRKAGACDKATPVARARPTNSRRVTWRTPVQIVVFFTSELLTDRLTGQAPSEETAIGRSSLNRWAHSDADRPRQQPRPSRNAATGLDWVSRNAVHVERRERVRTRSASSKAAQCVLAPRPTRIRVSAQRQPFDAASRSWATVSGEPARALAWRMRSAVTA